MTLQSLEFRLQAVGEWGLGWDRVNAELRTGLLDDAAKLEFRLQAVGRVGIGLGPRKRGTPN